MCDHDNLAETLYLKSRIFSKIIIFAVSCDSCSIWKLWFCNHSIFNWSLLMFFSAVIYGYLKNLVGNCHYFLCLFAASNLHYLYMIIKFIILATVITLFFMSEVSAVMLLHHIGRWKLINWNIKKKINFSIKRNLKFVWLIYLKNVFLLVFQVLFEKVFLMRPIKALFVRSDDSLHEWRFRWTLDRYVSKHITCRCISYV